MEWVWGWVWGGCVGWVWGVGVGVGRSEESPSRVPDDFCVLFADVAVPK